VLVRFVDALCDRSYDLAAHCMSIAPHALTPLGGDDRGAFLRFAEALAASGWADARAYLEKGPSLLAHLHTSQRVRFLGLARDLARREGRQAFAYFSEASRAMGQIPSERHGQLLALAEGLLSRSPVAAMEFLKSVPEVLTRIPAEELPRWHREGRQLLETSTEGAEAYFRRESSRGEEVLESLSARMELNRAGDVLRMYCKALTGADVAIHAADALTEKGIGWVEAEAPSTEGTAIYLPASVEEFRDKSENFAVYKVYATHQAGHLEFGSFQFGFERKGNILPSLRLQVEHELAPKRPEGRRALTDMERFFDLFQDRRLASDLFTIVEDARIDALIEREYAGIRHPYRRTKEQELDRRPCLEGLPLVQAMLENLVRASLGGFDRIRWPESMGSLLKEAIGVLQAVRQPGASVEDAAEATLRLYQLINEIPNVSSELMEQEWQEMEGESGQTPPNTADSLGQDLDIRPQGTEMPYESPQPVEFRGDFKPELVQLLSRLRQERQEEQSPPSPLSPEQLKAMLEKSVEVSLTDMAEPDLSQSSEQFINNLMKEMTVQEKERSAAPRVPAKEGQPVSGMSTPDEGSELASEPNYSYYDEWDFRAGDYKPRWCRVVEYSVVEGASQFFDQTVARYSSLAAQTRRQFELLRPELFRKIKHLLDGEEFDLDSVVEFLVEKRAGHTPPGKVYWRRNKVERDVSVAFLLDMSASTDEEIAKHERRYAQEEFDDPRRYFSWWMARRAQELMTPPKRIIDLEKESIVLLIRALETIGDIYGIYGFSGYGRENVEFYVIKDMEEPLSERIKRRIEKIAPVRSTRMGPAIRHATAKLGRREAKVRILFLVSDGRPQDHGYGRDRT
ncbi:MAG: nitric oxide reductase activation protein NorD, partial [Dehalococcoidia bacterium]